MPFIFLPPGSTFSNLSAARVRGGPFASDAVIARNETAYRISNRPISVASLREVIGIYKRVLAVPFANAPGVMTGARVLSISDEAAISAAARNSVFYLMDDVPVILSAAGVTSFGASTPLPPGNVAPTITTQPSITGNATTGSVLTLNEGAASGTPAPTGAIQWLRGTTAISGATGATYTLVAADEGRAISARVTWTNSAGSVERTSNAITGQAAAATPVVESMIVGYTDTSSVTVSAKVSGASSVVFSAVPTSGGTAITSAPVAANPEYLYAQTTINGLQPDTAYTITPQIAGVSQAKTGKARTRPTSARAFGFAFASCMERTRNHPILTTIANTAGVEAFVHLGDWGYFNPAAGVTSEDFAHQYTNEALANSHWDTFHRAMPFFYMFDDHEFSDGNANASTSTVPAIRNWYRNRMAQRPVRTGTSACHQMIEFAPGFRVFIMDTRTQRVSGDFLGAEQEADLMAAIAALKDNPTHVLGISGGVPIISSTDTDTWAGAAAQRQRIADAIVANGQGRVFWMHGDAHMLALDDGTNGPGGAPVFGAAPLGRSNSTKGGPYSGGTVTATQNQFGTIHATPTVEGWSITFKGYSVDAAGAATERLTFSTELKAPAQAAGGFAALNHTYMASSPSQTDRIGIASITPPKPGNLLVMLGGPDKETGVNMVGPAGWERIWYVSSNGGSFSAFIKVADGTETGPFVMSWPGPTWQYASLVLMEFEGPFDGLAVPPILSQSDVKISGPVTIGPSGVPADSPVLALAAYSHDSVGTGGFNPVWSQGWEPIVDMPAAFLPNMHSSAPAIFVARKVLATSEAQTVTFSSGLTDEGRLAMALFT